MLLEREADFNLVPRLKCMEIYFYTLHTPA
jgi:hypothetical protein